MDYPYPNKFLPKVFIILDITPFCFEVEKATHIAFLKVTGLAFWLTLIFMHSIFNSFKSSTYYGRRGLFSSRCVRLPYIKSLGSFIPLLVSSINEHFCVAQKRALTCSNLVDYLKQGMYSCLSSNSIHPTILSD